MLRTSIIRRASAAAIICGVSLTAAAPVAAAEEVRPIQAEVLDPRKGKCTDWNVWGLGYGDCLDFKLECTENGGEVQTDAGLFSDAYTCLNADVMRPVDD